MKIIINTSNLAGGGGVQVGFSFINECMKFSEHEYHIFLCPKIQSQLDPYSFPTNFTFYNFPFPPAPTIKGWRIMKRMSALENVIKPDCVFSVFGPTYWTPKAAHIMGFALGHFLYPKSPFFNKISRVENIKWSILSFAKRFFLKQNSKFYHVETEDVRKRLSKYLSCSINSIFTVSNTYNSIYNSTNLKLNKILLKKIDSEFRFVCISAYYSHKNLEILNEVIPLLKEKGLSNVKFVLTINEAVFQTIFSELAKTQIINYGPISINDCPQLYRECDAMFLPSLIECFSANYPEAMKMGKPILTSDLSFAHDVCGDAAIYFNPLDKNSISDSIVKLVNNRPLQLKLIEKGNMQLNKFINAEDRAATYLKICENICNSTK